MEVDETIDDKFAAETPANQENKSLICKDCGLNLECRRRFEEHQKRYHSPTSTQVLKIINCPYCPKVFMSSRNWKRHIALYHGHGIRLKVGCGHCPVQVTDTVLLRKHHRMIHPEERLTFKCPECEKNYRNRDSFIDHYKKHSKEAEADEKAKVNSASQSVEDVVKESGQINDQNVDGELTTGSAHRGKKSIKCEDCGLSFIRRRLLEAHRKRYHSPTSTHVLKTIICPYCPRLFTRQNAQARHIAAKHVQRETIDDKFAAETSAPRCKKSFKCEDCGLFFYSRARQEEHWKRYHSPTSTKVLKIINCPYCPQLFSGLAPRRIHIEAKHEQSVSELNCGHCSVQVTDSVQLRKHYRMVHPKEQFTIKCPKCKKSFLNRGRFSDHYKKHGEGDGLDDNADKKKCQDCGLFFRNQYYVKEHRKRYHSPTSTQVLKIINCPYCPKLFTRQAAQTYHIATKHVESASKINCGHCPLQLRSSVHLRKHYKMAHPEERVTFKCSECNKQYLNHVNLKDHFKKHKKHRRSQGKAGSDDKTDMNSPSEAVEGGLKENGQSNDQTADAELESIVINEEAFFQSEPVEGEVNKDDLNAPGELESIVIKEESIVQIGNEAASEVNAAAVIKDRSFNANTHSEQRVVIAIKQEPLDNGEATKSTDLAEEDQSTDAEGTSEQKSAAIEEQQVYFFKPKKEFQESTTEPVEGEQSKPSVGQQDAPTALDAEESGQANDQTADAELVSIVIKEEAIVQIEPVEDAVKEKYQNADEELISIVIKEESIVQIGNAAAVIKDGSFNANTHSEQRVVIAIKQEPLDNEEAAKSTDLAEE